MDDLGVPPISRNLHIFFLGLLPWAIGMESTLRRDDFSPFRLVQLTYSKVGPDFCAFGSKKNTQIQNGNGGGWLVEYEFLWTLGLKFDPENCPIRSNTIWLFNIAMENHHF